METQTQPQDQSSATPSYQCLAPLAVTSAIIMSSQVGYHCYRSKNVGPEVVCAGGSAYFEIPQDTTRKILYGFGPETEVARMDIEIINRETKEREIFQLTKEFPYKEIPITPNSSYVFKYRTHEDGHFWSSWSKLKPLVSRSPFFSLSAGEPSRARNIVAINKIGLGPRLNVLFIGKPGSGKSSLINSLLSAIAGEYREVAMTSPEGTTNTQCKGEHVLIPQKAYAYDMPGWEETFSLALLKRILERNIDITVNQLRGDVHDFQPQNPSHNVPMINCVILVMSAVTLKETRVFHSQIIELLKRTKMPCLGVVTKMDLIASDANKPVSRDLFFEDPRVIARYQQAPLDVNYPLINYDSNETTTNGRDELLLHILKTCQEKSKSVGANNNN